ncbi:hypothetical protein GCM10025790_00120 [Nesterenkonia rhizosphaerae]|uniref:AB hydrolase-1 domain-containing protein n=1 Tax=Nesterenkonia rhizosphaerae TaxID=1348272 RepID=A0ABP9FNY1_9MICC
MLETLLVNKKSDTIIAVFHGMMVPGHHHLPRFEWLRTLQNTEYSAIYFSDPTLSIDPQLKLGWYLGSESLDLFPVLASVLAQAAEATGASHLILAGSSGGAFASLQVSSYVPGSMAVAFNPQTDIAKYHWPAQASYLKRIVPQLIPDKGSRKRWSQALGPRTSVLKQYAQPRANRALLLQNRNDPHHVKNHFAPFREAITNSPNRDNFIFELYDGPQGHEPPSRGHFRDAVVRAHDLLASPAVIL